MRFILKNLWKNRKQNGWIFAEITVITLLSWFMVDHLVVSFYATHCCTPAGEFEKEHLVVGKFSELRGENESEAPSDEKRREGLYVIKSKLENLPEVQSVSLVQNYLGSDLALYGWRFCASREDTTRTIRLSTTYYRQDERFFETHGLQAIEGSPAVESLSKEIPADGVIITRSVAQQLFDTDQVVGKRVSMISYRTDSLGRDNEVRDDYTVAGVLEDVRESPSERYPYIAFFPNPYAYRPSPSCKLLIRLKPGVDAEAFVNELLPRLTIEYRAGFNMLSELETYEQHFEKQMEGYHEGLLTDLASVPLVLFAVNVLLGTLGTFWLQIRKRREDIGIMRAFGASKRRIFWQLIVEAAILAALASLLGDFIWLQFAASTDVLSNGNVHGGSGRETDWVTQFWPHFLIISFIVYMLILLVVSIAVSLPAWNVCRQKVVEALRSE